jgi:hypothetical protein
MQKLANFLIILGLSLFSNALGAQAPQSSFDANELLIRFVPGTSAAVINQFLIRYNAVEIEMTPISQVRLWRVQGFPVIGPGINFSNISEIIANATTAPEVSGGGANYASFVPAGYDDAPETPWTSTGICNFNLVCSGRKKLTKVVIMDSGVEYNCSTLSKRFDPEYPGYDFIKNIPEPYDNHGHGSHVAGIIHQVLTLNEIEDDRAVRFYAYKTHDQEGIGKVFNIIKGVDRAIQEQMQIINMSFSYYAPLRGSNTLLSKPEPLEIAINIAGTNGILVLAAAGNANQNNDREANKALPASFPCRNIISIASANCDKMVSTFSNWGPFSVDLVAPGEKIKSLFTTCNKVAKTGTSQATAIVSGVAALLGTNFTINENFNYQRVKCAILNGVQGVPGLHNSVLTSGGINGPGAYAAFYTNINCANSSQDGNRVASTTRSGTLSIAPNPFVSTLQVRFQAENAENARLGIWDAQGRQVFAQDWQVEPGMQEFSWEPVGQSPGIYTVRVLLNEAVYTSKAVLLR